MELKEIVTDALSYWEKRRLIYNIVLLFIVLYHFIGNPGKDLNGIQETFVPLFVCFIIANVLYCSAYVVDVFVQISNFQEQWRMGRFALFLVGTLFASILAWYSAESLFSLH